MADANVPPLRCKSAVPNRNSCRSTACRAFSRATAKHGKAACVDTAAMPDILPKFARPWMPAFFLHIQLPTT
eukprot:487294-Pyramimonas_sp.AAC.1